MTAAPAAVARGQTEITRPTGTKKLRITRVRTVEVHGVPTGKGLVLPWDASRYAGLRGRSVPDRPRSGGHDRGRHIANATILPRIHHLLNDLSIPIPIICTPEEMVNHDPETDD